MDYGLYRYDEPYARPVRRRINYFAWTVAILLLTGFAFAAWLGSFYIFSQPERPDSYRILQKLHKIDPPKRFEFTVAPPGEFLSAKQLYDRYNAMGTRSSPGPMPSSRAIISGISNKCADLFPTWSVVT